MSQPTPPDPKAVPSAVAKAAQSRKFLPSDFVPDSWDKIEPFVQKLMDRDPASSDDLEKWLIDLSEFSSVVDEYGSRRYIDKSCFTNDDPIKSAYLDFVENVEPKLKPAMFALQKKFLDSPHRDGLTGPKYDILKQHWAADVELFREENVPLETEVTKIVTKYDEVSGEMTVTFDGRDYTMQQMARFQEETDRDLRHRAWQASTDRRLADREAIDDLFDKVLPLRQQIAQNAGFDNYRDYQFKRLKRFDYTPADCDAFAAAVEKHVVPLVRELDDERKQALGIDNLRPWDLAVDLKGRGPLKPFDEENIDAFVQTTSDVFRKMSPDLASDFDELRTAGNLDLGSRPGKQPGGYQCNLEETGIPFIFMNAAGLQRDVETLLHEGGHAFHTLAVRDEPLSFVKHAPMEFCEVASMSMELLALPHMGDYFDKPDDADRARRHQLEGAAILTWIAIIDQFQHWLYTNPGHSRDERTAQWNGLLARFHHDLDWTGIEAARDAMWQRQLHLFHVPFYYIEYGIAQLGALQIYNNSKQDTEKAIAAYRRALGYGGTRSLPDLFEAAEIKFDFGDATIGPLVQTIRDDLSKLPA
ncbi:MAG: M3 family oligoendopeptidase [Planctomycetota bacterium]